jgi:hypothetical protein
LKDSRPKQKPHKSKEKRKGGKNSSDNILTKQQKNKQGIGNKMKTNHGTQTEHFHDINHNNPNKDNIHWRQTSKIKPGE